MSEVIWIETGSELPDPWATVLMATERGEVVMGSRSSVPGVWFIGDAKGVGRRCHDKVVYWAKLPEAPSP